MKNKPENYGPETVFSAYEGTIGTMKRELLARRTRPLIMPADAEAILVKQLIVGRRMLTPNQWWRFRKTAKRTPPRKQESIQSVRMSVLIHWVPLPAIRPATLNSAHAAAIAR
jgi:hypothetical protein